MSIAMLVLARKYIGSRGSDGTSWHSGEGPPDPSLGLSGDYYLQFATGDVYVKDTAWVVTGNVQGPQGEALGNLDGGHPDSVYTSIIADGGVVQ